MNNPKVSVMITTYNLVKYVDETIHSVVSQKVNFDYEILIGDDGSNDGTIDKIKSWHDKYPDLITYFVMDRDPNVQYNRIKRASRNRVNLLKEAKGEFIIYLDGDDLYTSEDKLQKQVDILESDEYRDCIACVHNAWLYYDENHKELINKPRTITRIRCRRYWREGMYALSNSIMYRNKPEMINKVLNDELMKDNFDDNLIMYSFLDDGDIVYLPEAMVNYRQVETSSWHSVEELEKNIINLLDIDLEKKYRPNYSKETMKRHTYQIFYIWKHSKELLTREGLEIKDRYLTRMEEDGLDESKKWLCYRDKSMGTRFLMSCWIMWKLVCYVPLFIKKRGPKRFN